MRTIRDLRGLLSSRANYQATPSVLFGYIKKYIHTHVRRHMYTSSLKTYVRSKYTHALRILV